MPTHKNLIDFQHYSFRSTETAQAVEFSLGPTRERAVLNALMKGGSAGASFYADPAPRWASSVHLLRKRGLDILTLKERHSGPHSGYHARYVLQTPVVHVPASSRDTD